MSERREKCSRWAWEMGMLHKTDCQEQMIRACCRTVYCGRRLRQGHGYLICQAKDLAFYPKSKVLPIGKVF